MITAIEAIKLSKEGLINHQIKCRAELSVLITETAKEGRCGIVFDYYKVTLEHEKLVNYITSDQSYFKDLGYIIQENARNLIISWKEGV